MTPQEPWEKLWELIGDFRGQLSRSKAQFVNSQQTRTLARQFVQYYFRAARPDLMNLGLDPMAFDEPMQALLRLSNGRNRRTSYIRNLQLILREQTNLDALRELRLGEARPSGLAGSPTAIERDIISTLEQLLPTAALSYRQALADLADQTRISHRGTAVELREALRELLDHFAPDDVVMKSHGFALEKGQTKPTMKQKVRFILRSRGLTSTATKTPENSVSLVEELTASLVRSAYDRESASTHVSGKRREILQSKMYVDSVLCELLEIHK